MMTNDIPLQWFRQASPYIGTHRGKTFVITFSGEAITHPTFHSIAGDIALLHSLGIRLVLVHGARPQIEQCLRQHQIATRYHEHLRIADKETMACVKLAIGGLHIQLEAQLSTAIDASVKSTSGLPISIGGGNFITAMPHGVQAGIDLFYTGKVRHVRAQSMHTQLEQNNLLLISPLGYSPSGETFDLDHQTLAMEIAVALKADKLITFIPEEDQPEEDRQEDDLNNTQQYLQRELTLEQLIPLAQSLPTDSPVAKALQTAGEACQRGIPRCHLISYEKPGALLEELLTRDGSGTLISHSPYEKIRQANAADVAGILTLIRPLEAEGILVARSRECLEREIDRFIIIERDSTIIACAALYPLTDNTAELACLTSHANYRRSARASQLLKHIEQHARTQGIDTLFVLTTQAMHWFIERGFANSTLDDLPKQRQELYNYQRVSKILRKTL